MGDKTQLQRIVELEDAVRELSGRVKVLETVTKVMPEEKRRGNPNWVKRGSE
jgi:hypothetical protein